MKNSYKPLIVAVFLIVAGLGSRNWLGAKSNVTEVKSILNGGQSASAIIGVAQAQGDIADGSAALVQGGNVVMGGEVGAPSTLPDDSYPATAIQDPGQPIGATTDGSQAIQYTVKKGDTLSGIAAKFNVSADSIVSANPNIRKKSLKIGQIITIPGVATPSSAPASTLPSFNGDFVMPAQGYNEGVLGADNSIEIENSCGTPVTAAADGVVVPDKNIVNTAGNWNDGYGTFVLIEHPFGNEVFTRYAHLQQSMVSIGAYVKQGQEIGLMGQTGGGSDCSLDFEVIGAQNPFGK